MGVRSQRSLLKCIAVSAAAVLLVVFPVACGDETIEPASTTTSVVPVETTASSTTTTVGPTTTSAPPEADTYTTVAISEASLVYAEDLGGTPHKGHELYFIVGTTAESVDEAQTLLENAIPSFGDMQSYFIVQISDNLAGMEPGRWVIVEAYRDEPSEENLEFARRAFPEAEVVQAIVRTSDPIPVYEEMMGL